MPARRAIVAELTMYLFLVSLAIFFVAGLLMLWLVRPPREAGALTQLPVALLASTAVLLTGSFTLNQAVVAVRRERQAALRTWLWISLAAAALFCLVQTLGLSELLLRHQIAPGAARLPGLIFFLAALHALHVVGGFLGVVWVMRQTYLGRYDHEYYAGVKLAALYWHFMDAVWLVMLGVFLAVY